MTVIQQTDVPANRRTDDRRKAGVDHFVGVAKNLRTGETCVARVNR